MIRIYVRLKRDEGTKGGVMVHIALDHLQGERGGSSLIGNHV